MVNRGRIILIIIIHKLTMGHIMIIVLIYRYY